MKIMILRIASIVVLCVACNLLRGCVTYDNAVVYQKNYDPGKNIELQFNGFYRTKNNENLFPIFFYADGSVLFAGFSKDTIELKAAILSNPKTVWGYWGNYKISRDTIIVETFPPNINTFNQDRYLRKGIIHKDQIVFFGEIKREGKTNNINETIEFVNFKTKPDSTANWIRKKKKYNK